MSNATEFFFGLFLWLISCGFILSLYCHTNELKSDSNLQKSPNSSVERNLLEEKLFNSKNIPNLETEISPENFEQLQQELKLAQEKIWVLSEELEIKSKQLQLKENQPSEWEAKLRQENQKFQHKIAELEAKYQDLKTNFAKQLEQIKTDFKERTFKQLYSLLINYPTAKVMVKVKPNLPAKNLVALFKPLDNLLANWGISPIGKPWEKVIYNPNLHQADTKDIQRGESVYIRFIGYRYGNRILYPAKVSRTLLAKKTK